jgi:hypothetical protein
MTCENQRFIEILRTSLYSSGNKGVNLIFIIGIMGSIILLLQCLYAFLHFEKETAELTLVRRGTDVV